MSEIPLFEAKGVGKDYPLAHGQMRHVLDSIDLVVNPHEVVALIGPSGCGKSTLLRILAGLIPKSRGQILYKGQELQGLMPGMSMVFQSFALYPWMTVQQNIEIVLKALRVPCEEMKKRIDDAIHIIGLAGFEEAYPREISGGMKQRVGMARALVCNPDMLFMDEPFSEVDAFTAEVLRQEVLKVWSSKEFPLSSIVIVSHDIREVAFMADRIVVLGSHPATIRAIIDNRLPRPRDSRSPDYLRLVEQLHDSYGQIEIPQIPPGKKEPIGPLLPVYTDQILGLLRDLNRRGGTSDIFKIGAESNQPFDKIALILQAAELLNFVELMHRNATITPLGKKFAEGSREARHRLWKDQLLTIPLIVAICDLLKNHPQTDDEIIYFLTKALPHQDAASQFAILLRWGHYGELFTYNKKSKKINLTEQASYPS